MIELLLAASLGAASSLFSAAPAEAAPDLSTLAQYGPGGVVAMVFGLAWWYQVRDQKETLRLERARGDRLETANAELNRAIHEKYIPATTQMLGTATQLAQVTAETTRVLQAWRDRDR